VPGKASSGRGPDARAIPAWTWRGWRPYALLGLLCLGLYLPGAGALPVTDRDEARFAQATRQMLESGDYLRIRFQDEARNRKPAGIYWLQALSVASLSDASQSAIWPYRMPSLLGAVAAVFLTFALGRALVGVPAALLGAALLACSLTLVAEAHLAKTDAVLLGLAAAAQLSLGKIYCAARRRGKSRGKHEARPRSGEFWALLFWAALGASALVKGPVAPLLAGLTALSLAAADREARWLLDLRPLWGAALFLAIGALTSQLAPTRRQANGLAASIFAACFVIRMVADSVSSLGWMRWISPVGWVENLHPFTGSQPLALVPIILLTVGAATLAVTLAGRRDLGTAVLARHKAVKADTRLLGSPARLVIRLERWVALAWIGALVLLGLIFGLVARSAVGASGVVNRSIEQSVVRLGGHHGGAAAAWIGFLFLFIAALVAFAAAGQISAMRGEEADGHLDNLLARRLKRGTWLAGRVGFGAALVVAAGLATAIGGWIGVAGGHGHVGFWAMLQAGLNLMPAALFILGLGTLLYGLLPRIATPILYVVVLWSFLIDIIGSSITSNHLLLDTALLSHLGPVPAASLNWTAIGVLTGLGVITALAGLAAFQRRDLAAA